jgi:8-oxo-dGTP pyrophosphatase MutT (NUDIX family)
VTSAAQLRERLLTPEAAAEIEVPGLVDAAVLVPLYLDAGKLHAVFTKRRAELRRHAGEISFPGGRQDPDDESLLATALREAEEEIGLPRGEVQLVGALPPTPTVVTGYRIHPFVGVIDAGRAWTPQPSEVESVLELPLAALARGHRDRRLVRKGVPFKTVTYTVDEQLVWGATARIVRSLLERLGPLVAADGGPGGDTGA